MNIFIFKKTLIIGLGLIGGSFAKAIKINNLSENIFAYDENLSSIEKAKKGNIIDDLYLIDESIVDFDLIVIATPLNAYKQIFTTISKLINNKNLVIDLGSIKDFSSLSLNMPYNFIGCHPITGSHKIGFENSDSELFVNKKFIICLSKNILPDVKKIENMAIRMQANVEFLDAKNHDKIFSLTSHLPQFLSFLTKEFSPKNLTDSFLKNAFRLDQSSPEIWLDIFNLNEKNLENYYQEFFINLTNFCENILNLDYYSFQQIALDYDISSQKINEDNIFNDQFPSIFFRFIVALSYLQIKDLKKFSSYFGSGFRDFCSIISMAQLSPEKINIFVKKDFKKIQKLYHSIS